MGVEKFELLFNEYLHSDKLHMEGILSVVLFVNELHLCPSYFGGFIKKKKTSKSQKIRLLLVTHSSPDLN